MKAFAALLDRLSYTPSRNDKLRLLAGYFANIPDPDRGYALAALTDGLFFRLPLRRILTDLIGSRVDPVLFDLSRDYVGDTAETIALIWPGGGASAKPPRLASVRARFGAPRAPKSSIGRRPMLQSSSPPRRRSRRASPPSHPRSRRLLPPGRA